MSLPKKLFRTTIVIWTEDDPSELGIDNLAREAINGNAFCSRQETREIKKKSKYPDTEFFGVDDEDE